MEKCYLAVDIGASSGRHILGSLTGGLLRIQELHRFPNGARMSGGSLCWDVEALFEAVLAGLRECGRRGCMPESVGIDTWGVDFVLLDGDGRRLGPAVSYRDSRTEGMDEAVYALVCEAEFYARTGIQRQPFNTIFQLMALRKQHPQLLDAAHTLLLMPDYLHYRLTGAACAEYTNATTTGLIHAETGDWDWALIARLGLPERLFPPIRRAGEVLGPLLPGIASEVGFQTTVVLPATHDTGSAVAAVPFYGPDDRLYLSSGTWSLLGTERNRADCSPESARANFTNEGGYGGTCRYLKNIMGLWMVQSVRRELGEAWDFSRISQTARAQGDFPARVDVNAPCFLSPSSMSEAVRSYCRESGQPIPLRTEALLAVLYHSLADCYGQAVRELEGLTGQSYTALHIVGGGSQDGYLNELTARAVGKPVLAGPVEATALGNLLVQMAAGGAFPSLDAARTCVARSFPPTRYSP